jgi:regulator of sigma E protease
MNIVSDLLRMLLAGAGIGLVIFIHEAGHFLAARWCGVRVEVFSLGFGPRLLSWRRGPTTYQLALVPIGGYVRMAGEDARADGSPPAPDELPAKSVGQRFLIYSGGVLMNLAFGLVTFPILFTIGVPFLEPVIGRSLPGGPAWEARLPEGARVLRVNGQEVFEFTHVPTQVALGDPEGVRLELELPDGTRSSALVRPRYVEEQGFQSIDLSPPLDPEHRLEVAADGAAARAGLVQGERLLGVAGAPRLLDPYEQLGWAAQGGGALRLELEGAAGPRSLTVEPEEAAIEQPARLGLGAPRNLVHALRANASLEALGLRAGDRLLKAQGLDILRLGDLERALEPQAQELDFEYRRGTERLRGRAPWIDEAQRRALIDDIALRPDLESTAIVVTAGEAAAEAGLRDGDRVLRVDRVAVHGWRELQGLVARAAREERAVELAIERAPEAGAAISVLEVEARPRVVPALDYGLAPRAAHYVYRASGPLDAIRVGVLCSWRFVQDSWLTLKRILLGQVSGDNVGGIITIGAVSYTWAEAGLAKLFFFLCLLSLNLAFINVLPIPVLDGGHLAFLLIEKIKGSPVSERVLAYSQMAGLVLLVSLMVYVTYNDLVRWVFPG